MATETLAVRPQDDLSNILTTLDALHSRMDSLEVGAGSKNPIKGGRKDAEEDNKMAAKDDAKSDGEKEEVKKDWDEEDKKKDDAEEEDKKADAKKGDDDEGEQEEEKKAPPVVADKKRKDQASAPSSSAKARPPIVSGRGDVDEGMAEKVEVPKKADRRKDEDEDEDAKRRDAAIADAAARNDALERKLSEQAEMIARLNAMVKPRSDKEHEAFAEIQAKADAIYEQFGKRAPRPLEGESTLNYDKRLMTGLKMHSPAWKQVKLSQLPEEAVPIAREQIYADAARAAATASDVGEGELREVVRRDPQTGVTTRSFYGRESFVKGMGQRARRVTRINTQFGRQ